MSHDHGRCPNCDADLNGGSIWEYFLDATGGDEEEADLIASMYGATRDSGRWGRQLGIYSMDHDRTVQWQCPDCQHVWDRKEI